MSHIDRTSHSFDAPTELPCSDDIAPEKAATGMFENGIPIKSVPSGRPPTWVSWFKSFFSWNNKKSSLPAATSSEPAKSWFSWLWPKKTAQPFSTNRGSAFPKETLSQPSNGNTDNDNGSNFDDPFQDVASVVDEYEPAIDEIEEAPAATATPVLKTIDPFENLSALEKTKMESTIAKGKLFSKKGDTQLDAQGLKSLPEYTFYYRMDLPAKNAAAIFWDPMATAKNAPNRIKTSDIKFLTDSSMEGTFETKVSNFLSNDVSKVTTHVEPVANGGYLFTWSLSPEEQPRAYAQASQGSLLLLPDGKKTLLVYKSISTLKDNTFYSAACTQIEGTLQSAVQGVVTAMNNGQQNAEKLSEQIQNLEKACGYHSTSAAAL